MRTPKMTSAFFALALMPAAAAGSEESGRYTMSPSEGGGFVRLDTQTGTMALCTRKDGTWACEAMADSQRALQTEMDKLEAENKSLKEQVQQLEDTLGLGENGTPERPKDPATKLTLPTEQDVDKAFDYLEGMMKKIRERMEKLEENHEKGDGTAL